MKAYLERCAHCGHTRAVHRERRPGCMVRALPDPEIYAVAPCQCHGFVGAGAGRASQRRGVAA